MTLPQAALTFVSLLVIVDPIALAPVFAALTGGMTPARARRTARVAVLAGFGLLAAAGLAGHLVVRALAAETAPLHLALAGLLVAMGALMLGGRGGLDAVRAPARRDPAVAPLAVPLIAGPGALGAMVAFAGREAGRPAGLVTLYALLAAVGVLTYLALRASEPIARRLGERGVRMVTRVLGAALILAGARFLYEGLQAYGLVGGRSGAGAAA
jgi:multiple antibiotic resistance protein